ncbi:6117_t:CDS:2, partial [Cetraspora pellucida]
KEGHIACDCLEKPLRNRSVNKPEDWRYKERCSNKENEKQKGPDVRLVDLTNEESDFNKKYLAVEIVDDKQDLGDIRNLEKRKQDEEIAERQNKRGRPQKALKIKEVEVSSSDQRCCAS